MRSEMSSKQKTKVQMPSAKAFKTRKVEAILILVSQSYLDLFFKVSALKFLRQPWLFKVLLHQFLLCHEFETLRKY